MPLTHSKSCIRSAFPLSEHIDQQQILAAHEEHVHKPSLSFGCLSLVVQCKPKHSDSAQLHLLRGSHASHEQLVMSRHAGQSLKALPCKYNYNIVQICVTPPRIGNGLIFIPRRRKAYSASNFNCKSCSWCYLPSCNLRSSNIYEHACFFMGWLRVITAAAQG